MLKTLGKALGGLAATVAVTAGAYLPFVISDAKRATETSANICLCLEAT